jgi:hypothetical protein
MFRRRVPAKIPPLKVFRSQILDRTRCAEEGPDTRQLFNIDELAASPWIGLHHRHEFLLHHSHHLLEQPERPAVPTYQN